MAVTVTNTAVTAFNTVSAVTTNSATADTDALSEVFTITPSKTTAKLAIIIGGNGTLADGDVGYSFAAGDFWAGTVQEGTVTKGTENVVQVETAKVLKRDGTIALTLTPAATDKLKTDHSAYVKVLELI